MELLVTIYEERNTVKLYPRTVLWVLENSRDTTCRRLSLGLGGALGIILGQKPLLVGPGTAENTPKQPRFGASEILICTHTPTLI